MVSLNPADLTLEELCDLEGAIDSALLVVLKVAPRRESKILEAKIVDTIGRAWKSAANAAVTATVGKLIKGPYAQPRINAFLKSLGLKLKQPLTSAQITVIEKRLQSIWKIAKKWGAKQAKTKFEFGLVDKRAVAAINRHQVFWVNTFYSDKLSRRIRAVSEDVLLRRGLSHAEAGRALQASLRKEFGVLPGGRSRFAPTIPARYAGNPDLYFRQVASTAAHQSRTFGTMTAFQEAEVVSYQLINPDDERTGQICQQMSGQVFSVDVGVMQMNSILSATDPQDVKDIAPWLSGDDIESTIGGAATGSTVAADRLAAAGAILPPFHSLCRTDVVIMSGPSPSPRVYPSIDSPGAKAPRLPASVPEVGGSKPMPIGNPLPLGLPKGVRRPDQIGALSVDELRASVVGDLRVIPLSTSAEVTAAIRAVDKGVEAGRKIFDGLKSLGDIERAKLARRWLTAANADKKALVTVKDEMLKVKKGRNIRGDRKVVKKYKDAASMHYPESAINHMANQGFGIEVHADLAKAMGRGSGVKKNTLGLFVDEIKYGDKARKPKILIREDIYYSPRFREVVVHEHGHFVDSTVRWYYGELSEAVGKKEFVSSYAKTNSKELFAEINSKATMRGVGFAAQAPERSALIEAMMSSDEAYRRSWMIAQRSRALSLYSEPSMQQVVDDIITAAKNLKPKAPPVPKPKAVKPVKPSKTRARPPKKVKPPRNTVPPTPKSVADMSVKDHAADQAMDKLNVKAFMTLPKNYQALSSDELRKLLVDTFNVRKALYDLMSKYRTAGDRAGGDKIWLVMTSIDDDVVRPLEKAIMRLSLQGSN